MVRIVVVDNRGSPIINPGNLHQMNLSNINRVNQKCKFPKRNQLGYRNHVRAMSMKNLKSQNRRMNQLH
jgi:hypothetical protein